MGTFPLPFVGERARERGMNGTRRTQTSYPHPGPLPGRERGIKSREQIKGKKW